jgi:Family of unknown function (DUF5996)
VGHERTIVAYVRAECAAATAAQDLVSVIPMPSRWPAVSYSAWRETCDTVHSHAQVLGKIAAVLAPPEPELLHAALQLTARGLETRLLPAPNDSGAIVVVLDLQRHEVGVERTDGEVRRVPLTPDRAVGAVTREVLAYARELAGDFEINVTPKEVPWSVPLDEDQEHARYVPEQVAGYFQAATSAAVVLAAFRAPYRGRSTPVNAWWGSFDLAVSLFSGAPAEPPSEDFISRNSLDAQEVAVGWWPGDARHDGAAFYAYAHPAPDAFAQLELPLGGWDETLGEYLLEWDDVRGRPDPHAAALDFARRIFEHACAVCDWDPALASSAEGTPPPIR